MVSPAASVRVVHGIGEAVAEKLEKLGILTIGDLLRWYPRDYIDASQPVLVKYAPYGRLSAIRVTILKVNERYSKGRGIRLLEVLAEDGSDTIILRWFNQAFLKQKLQVGSQWICIGVINSFHGEKTMAAPLLEESPRILSVYAQTKGVTSKMIRGYLGWVLAAAELNEQSLPAELREAEGLEVGGTVLRHIHAPLSMEEVEAAKRQLAFEEVFWFFVRMAAVRQEQQDEKGMAIDSPVDWLKTVVSALPFELTNGQKRAVWDSLQDMRSSRPMTRLLNGDVGSGKTVVAALIAASVAKTGFQSAILAPTEILAQQHFQGISALLEKYGIRVAQYTASRKDALDDVDIVIGTHALLQEGVQLPRLAFVAVDEQHRFGVKQRQGLREGRQVVPHLLSMTATPIPRTLALSLYGDLSLSLLPEKPKDRLPILTQVVYPAQRKVMYERLHEEIVAGHQVFVICPLIQEKPQKSSDDSDLALFTVLSPEEIAGKEKKTVVAEVERLRKEYGHFGTIESVHGKMKPKEKEAVMERMAKGEIAVLVATSVVEVGVNIPNATVMVVEGAEQFGLAQLHQFRGRVGRGKDQSYCFLCPTFRAESIDARLQTVARTESGFELAQADLDLRGPGELVGHAQSGLPDFKMASLTDVSLLQRVRLLVDDYVVKRPEFLKEYSKTAFQLENAGLE